MTSAPRAARSAVLAAAATAILLSGLTGCGSIGFERTSETSGTFHATGMAFTIFSIDLPKGAQLIARENASDANLPNMEVMNTTVFPYLGPFDWILDIISLRWAKVEGTWGYAPRP